MSTRDHLSSDLPSGIMQISTLTSGTYAQATTGIKSTRLPIVPPTSDTAVAESLNCFHHMEKLLAKLPRQNSIILELLSRNELKYWQSSAPPRSPYLLANGS